MKLKVTLTSAALMISSAMGVATAGDDARKSALKTVAYHAQHAWSHRDETIGRASYAEPLENAQNCLGGIDAALKAGATPNDIIVVSDPTFPGAKRPNPPNGADHHAPLKNAEPIC